MTIADKWKAAHDSARTEAAAEEILDRMKKDAVRDYSDEDGFLWVLFPDDSVYTDIGWTSTKAVLLKSAEMGSIRGEDYDVIRLFWPDDVARIERPPSVRQDSRKKGLASGSL